MRVPVHSLRAMLSVGEGGASLLFAMAVVCVTMIYLCCKTPQRTPTEEETAKRASQSKRLAALPEHLRLGVTLPGMRELLAELPSNAVKQVNAKIPPDKITGKPKFPKNKTINGYVSTSISSPSGPRRTTATSTSTSLPGGPRGTTWPCASGCRCGGRRTWARPPCS